MICAAIGTFLGGIEFLTTSFSRAARHSRIDEDNGLRL